MNELKLTFDFKPRKWQAQCFEKQTRFTVLAVHRRAGKTAFALAELIIKALNVVGNYLYIAPEKSQAKAIVWNELRRQLRQFQHVQYGGEEHSLVELYESEITVRFWNGSQIVLQGADKPDRIRGQKIAGVVIDEVAQCPKELWEDAVYPALLDSNGWGLFIGTPKGINLFSDLYNKGTDPKFPDWSSQTFTCYETQALEPKAIQDYKETVGEETFKREMLCDFGASTQDQFIDFSVIEAAMTRQIDDAQGANERAPLVMGVDVARYGSDSSVIMFRRGLVAYEPQTLKGVDLYTLAVTIKQKARDMKPKAIFVDGTGVGGGVVDILMSFGLTNMNDINFGQKAAQQNLYINKRCEMWDKMKEWLKRGSIPRNDRLARDLGIPLYEFDDKHRLKMESKKEIRGRLHESPDLADALALTFAEDVFDSEETDALGVPVNSPKQTFAETCNPFEQYKLERSHRGRKRNNYWADF